MFGKPLAGVRVLSMEQAAALPYATRHLVDLGAEVIRVMSPTRANALNDGSLFRGKRMLGLDLSRPQGPEVFRKIARHCDVVAHNYTPRVMRKYGIDFASIAAVQPNVIYCSLTGYGIDGPWAERPLFGPGAEAFSGHNLLIGEPSQPPGRPGTNTYADYLCGSYLLLSVLEALRAQRAGSWRGPRLIDISLYDTAVAHLGVAIAARSAGGPLPMRQGNRDAAYAFQGCLNAADGRYVAVSIDHAQLNRVLSALGVGSVDELETLRFSHPATSMAQELQCLGVAACVVADAADIATSPQLWARGFFGCFEGEDTPQFGPAWGGGAAWSMQPPRPVGSDNRELLATLGEYDPDEITALEANAVIAETVLDYSVRPCPSPALEVERALLERVDVRFAGWRDVARSTRAVRADVEGSVAPSANTTSPSAVPRVLELAGNPASQWAARLLLDLGWDVVRVEDDSAASEPTRWGGAEGAEFAYLNRGKHRLSAKHGLIDQLAQVADVVIGAKNALERPRRLGQLRVALTPFGSQGPRANEFVSDFTLQAASGFAQLTGEHDQAPQQLPPLAAHLLGGVTAAAAIVAAAIQMRGDRTPLLLDLAIVEPLTSFTHVSVQRYLATGEVSRREGKVKQALRMTPTQRGYLYCAPGAVATVSMEGVATLLDDNRLKDRRFATADARMDHWDEYLTLMQEGFAKDTADSWFRRAEALHLTFALVQSIDDLLACPQLAHRGLLTNVLIESGAREQVRPYVTRQLRMPDFPVHLQGRASAPMALVPVVDNVAPIIARWR